MTVSTTTSRVSYPGAGSAGPFSFNFQIHDADDLVVVLEDSAGTRTTLTRTDDYTVTGVGDRAGGSVTLETALAVGETLVLARLVDLTQATSLRTQGGAYYPEDVETALDRLVMIDQQQQRVLDRAVALPDGSTADPTLPTPVASRVLRWNSAADALEGVAIADPGVALPAGRRTVTSLETYLANGAVFNVKDYGAVADYPTDDYAAFAAALLDLADAGGGVLLVPPGRFNLSEPLLLPPYTSIVGYGMQTSILQARHDGDGVYTDFDLNGSTGAFVRLADVSLQCASVTNAGGGFTEQSGTYVWLDRVHVEGFQHGIILDQTEIARLTDCYTNQSAAHCLTGIWLVNGASRRVGGSGYFTNGIEIVNHQFNAISGSSVNLRDDGGVNHHLRSCNFNGGGTAVEVCGVWGFSAINCASEGHDTVAWRFVDEDGAGTTYWGPTKGLALTGNSFNDATDYGLNLNAVVGGVVSGNFFSAATLAAAIVSGDAVSGVSIYGNHKRSAGANRIAAAFLAGTADRIAAQDYRQRADTYATSGAIVAGARTVTPASMGNAGETDAIVVGSRLHCVNTDGTNGEVVTVTAVGVTDFTATFASAKGADFLITGV